MLCQYGSRKPDATTIVFIVLIIVLIIIGGTILTIWLIDKNSNNTPVEVDLYEDYVEGEGFVTDEDMAGAQMTPLAAGLKEYRNDELGIRFGYLDELEIPEDSEEEDGTYVSVMKSNSSEKSVMFRVGKIDVSQTDIDHIQKQKEALTKELIKAETYTVEEEVNGEKVLVPELYLSQATLDAIDNNNGSKISGFNVSVNNLVF